MPQSGSIPGSFASGVAKLEIVWTLGVVYVLAIMTMIYLKKSSEYYVIGSPRIAVDVAHLIAANRNNQRVIISHGLWPYLRKEDLATARLWTFSIASKPALRRRYEQTVYASMNTGQIMFVEEASAGTERPLWSSALV